MSGIVVEDKKYRHIIDCYLTLILSSGKTEINISASFYIITPAIEI